jgi:hypothetical protein
LGMGVDSRQGLSWKNSSVGWRKSDTGVIGSCHEREKCAVLLERAREGKSQGCRMTNRTKPKTVRCKTEYRKRTF